MTKIWVCETCLEELGNKETLSIGRILPRECPCDRCGSVVDVQSLRAIRHDHDTENK